MGLLINTFESLVYLNFSIATLANTFRTWRCSKYWSSSLSFEPRQVQVSWLWGHSKETGWNSVQRDGLPDFQLGSISVCVRTSDTPAWSGLRTKPGKGRCGQKGHKSSLGKLPLLNIHESLLWQIHGISEQCSHVSLEAHIEERNSAAVYFWEKKKLYSRNSHQQPRAEQLRGSRTSLHHSLQVELWKSLRFLSDW